MNCPVHGQSFGIRVNGELRCATCESPHVESEGGSLHAAGSADWSIGDKVLFDVERGYPILRPVRYGGTITKRLGNNYWEVIGFGFRAELSGELMTPNPVYSQNGADELRRGEPRVV